MVEVFEGAPVAVGDWVLTNRHDLVVWQAHTMVLCFSQTYDMYIVVQSAPPFDCKAHGYPFRVLRRRGSAHISSCCLETRPNGRAHQRT